MYTLELLNKKLKTTQDLLSVVKTMKSLAAVNIRQFEHAVESLEKYREIVDKGWEVLFRFSGPVSWKSSGKNAVCIVIGSDQGMCGQFNETAVSHALEKVKGLTEKGLEVTFWSLGEKISGALEDMGYKTGEQLPAAANLTAINNLVQIMVQQIESWRSGKGIEYFYVCHNILVKERGQSRVFYRLLPLDKDWADQYRAKKWPERCLPLMGLPREDMFVHLFRQYIFISLYRAVAQSLAGENAARLFAMQAAEKNIQEQKEELQALFREQRQAEITNELLDIISGFEA